MLDKVNNKILAEIFYQNYFQNNDGENWKFVDRKNKDKRWFKDKLKSPTFYKDCKSALNSTEFEEFLYQDTTRKLDSVLETMDIYIKSSPKKIEKYFSNRKISKLPWKYNDIYRNKVEFQARFFGPK